MYTLSSSSDEDEKITKPLFERIATKKRSTSPSSPKIPRLSQRAVHSISDSEESDDDTVQETATTQNKPFDEVEILHDVLASERKLDGLVSLHKETCGMLRSPLSSYKESSADDFAKTSSRLEQPDALNLLQKQKKTTTRMRNTKKEADEEKLKAREMKLKEKQTAKALKDLDRELQRSAKPQECLKSMRLSIDDHLTEVANSEIVFNFLLDNDMAYTIQKNPLPYSIVWYRRVADITVEDAQVLKKERDLLEKEMVVYMSSILFTEMIGSHSMKKKGKVTTQQTLIEYIKEIQTMFPTMKLTIITLGLDSHLRRKPGGNKEDNDTISCSQKNKKISKKDVDEAVVELHLECFVNYHDLNSMAEFGSLLARFTKAIAETPFKLEKQQQQKAFSWYAQADSSCPVKVDKDGKGSINLWQQQICQFNNVGKEVAQAIAARYPSPLLLAQAYARCSSKVEAEKLLQDIVVRRDFGPLGTTRRVGPELSYKICRFFTSSIGNELLHR